MTPGQGVSQKLPAVNWRNFGICCIFAKDSHVSTVLITGKGETTLFPERITDFLVHLQPYNFPFLELQNNGIVFLQKRKKYQKYLKEWYNLGLTTMALSIVHYDQKIGKMIYQPDGSYFDLAELIPYLHSFGYSVRLSCMMFKGGIDSIEGVKKIIRYAKDNHAEQLTVRSIGMPENSENKKVAKWVSEHKLAKDRVQEIKRFLDKEGKKLMPLAHGAMVYDYKGQNICLSNCLTLKPSSEEIRQLIFFPDGHLRYDWRYPGAILL